MSALDLAAVRSRFPALSRVQDGRPVVFADAPGGSQVPDTVIEAVSQRYRDGISNMDGAFVVSEETEELAAAARRAGADLVGAEPDQIVFGANSTSLLLHLSRSFARTIGPGDTVVVTRLDHDANVRPWVLAAARCRRHRALGRPAPRGRHARSGVVRRRPHRADRPWWRSRSRPTAWAP